MTTKEQAAYTVARSMTSPNAYVVRMDGRLQTTVTRGTGKHRFGWSVAVVRRNSSGTLTPMDYLRVRYWDDAIAAIEAGRHEWKVST